MNSLHTRLWLLLAGGWIWFALPASALYVDAEPGNTAWADGSAAPWSSTTSSYTPDGLWYNRPGYGNDVNGEIGTSSTTIIENWGDSVGQIVTTADGLTPAQWYRVDVVYWSKSGAENWNVTVGFSPESRTLYSYNGSDIYGLATVQGEFTGRVGGGGNSIYEMTGMVGLVQADAYGDIKVYIDDIAAIPGQSVRTWYDGLLITEYAAPPPEAPTGLTAAGTQSVVTLAWTQSVTLGVTGNRIYRSTTGEAGSYSLLVTLPATTSYVDGAVSLGQTYHYVVRAVDANGESVDSNSASAVPQAPGEAPEIHSVNPAANSEVGSLSQITVAFSGSVVGVDAADLLVAGQSAAWVVGEAGSDTYTFSFPQPDAGPVAVGWIASHGITEPGGTPFDAAAPGATWSYTLVDAQHPHVVQTSPLPGTTVPSLTQVEITFSESVLGIDAADLIVNGLPAASMAGSGAGPYVFGIAPPSDGIVQVTWASGHGITDASPALNDFEGDPWAYTLDPAFGQDLLISEFLAVNDGGLRDENETSPDWIEIHNTSGSTVHLGGWHLTDNAGDLARWTFPSMDLAAGGYLVVFASGENRSGAGAPLHTSFELDAGGGYLALVRPDGTVAHSYAPEYPGQRANVSYGLVVSGDPRYFATPTPGAANGTGFLGLVADTKFSMDRGFYEAPIDVKITCATAGSSIYWTTNGSMPTPSSGTFYTGPVRVSGTTMLRAAAFLTDHVSSVPDAQTYIFLAEVLQQPALPVGYPTTWQADYPADYEMDPTVVNSSNYGATLTNDLRAIPTLSIVSDHDNFWDPATGICVDANRRTEYPASAELFNGDGTSAFQINCGVRMQGAASRDNVRLAKHSFRLVFRGDYGPSKLKHDWFPGAADAFNTITLRACFTDSWATRANGNRYRPHDSLYLRDVWMKESMLDMGHLAGHGGFVHLYVNGLYWGLYNPTERLDANYFAEYLGGFEQDWDVMRDFNELLAGDRAGWDSLIAEVNGGINSEADYQAIAEQVDIDNLIDYLILHFLGEAEDWPSHNWYAARRRANPAAGLPATQWIFLPWDQEIVLDAENTRDETNVSNDNTPARIYSQLRNWLEFRVRFGDRVQMHLFNGGALTPSNNVTRLQNLAARIDRAIVGESARWGDAREFTIGVNPGHGETFTRDEWWEPEVLKLTTTFLPNVINPLTLSRLQNRGLYPTVSPPAFSQFGGAVSAGFGLTIAHANPSGTIYYTTDDADPRTYGTGAVSSTALAYSNPVVINRPERVRARVLRNGSWSALVDAVFYPPQDLESLALTEIMYNPPDYGSISGSDLEYLEIKNTGTNTLDLSGLTFTKGIDFAFPVGTVLEPGAFFVLARSATAFAARYPGIAVDGTYSGQLNNGGEAIVLSHALGTPVFSVTYNNRAPWPSTPDLADFSLVQRQPGASQAPDSGSSWRACARAGGSPGADDPEPGIAPIVLNEILAHTDSPQKDSIELYNPASTNVDIGGWYASDDAGTPTKFRIPDGTIIEPGGYVWFDEDDFNPAPGVGTSFSFSSTGDDAYLYSAAADGTLTGYDHGMKFGASFNGQSFGRHVNSAGETFYPRQLSMTLGGTNAGPEIGPVVISEINYHPDATGDEFVELANISSSSVPLFSEDFPSNVWKVSGLGYTFPPNVTLAANSMLLLVATNPASFRAKYNVPAEVMIVGPYAGQLQDSGENLEVQAPDNPNADDVPYVVIDGVRYNDKSPWPPAADGGGLSLQRVPVSGYGNEPLNWTAAAPTPGIQAGSGDSDGDGIPDSWEQDYGTLVFVNDANDDLDHDGLTNLEEYQAGTHPNDASSVLKLGIIGNAAEISLEFSAVSNHTYSLFHHSSLHDPWLKVSDIPALPTNRMVTITNAVPDEEMIRFYRLATPMQP